MKSEPPAEAGKETGEGATSSDTAKDEQLGALSLNLPDPTGQTQHWKLPGT